MNVVDLHYFNHTEEWIGEAKNGNWAASSNLEKNLGKKQGEFKAIDMQMERKG